MSRPRVTGPGPVCALALPIEASAFGGGGRLEMTAATAIAAATSSTSTLTSRRRRTAALDGGRASARSEGTVLQQIPGCDEHRGREDRRLDDDRLAVRRLPERGSVGRWRTDAPMPDPRSSITEPNATFEKRGTATASPFSRRSAGRPRHSTSSPIRPPIQSEPATRCSQSNASASARGRRLRRVAGHTGDKQNRRRGEHCADRREQLGHGAPLAVGTIDPERHAGRDCKEREQQLEVEVAAPERGCP